MCRLGASARPPLTILALLLTLAQAGPAKAAPPGGSAPGAAEFDYGLAEMQAGRYGAGCPALAESYRLDPRPGVLFTLAECENQWGKLASALTHYEAYLDIFDRMTPGQKSRQRGRDKIAVTQRDALRRDVPRLAVAAAASAPPGSTLFRDGVALSEPSGGELTPVDPGDHQLLLKTPSGTTKEVTVTLERGDVRRIEIPAPEPEPPPPVVPPPPAPAPAPPASAPTSATSAASVDEGTTSGRRAVLYSALAVGIVGVAVGGISGAIVLTKKSTIDAHCVNAVCDSPDSASTANSAKTFGTMSTIGFAVGGAGLATAFVLWLTEPSRPEKGKALRVAPFATAGVGGGLGASGRF